jgi:hypothetical protein
VISDTGLIALDRHGWLPAESSPRRPRKLKAGSSRAALPRRQPRSSSRSRASSSRR